MARFDRVRDQLDYALAVRLSQDVAITPSPEVCDDLADFESGVWDEDFRKYPHRSYSFTLFGKKCLLTRHRGNWCGYAQAKDPSRGFEELDVHGEITGGSKNMIGFDTAHYGDISPSLKKLPEGNQEGVYWTFEAARAEVCWLARQLHLLEEGRLPLAQT